MDRPEWTTDAEGNPVLHIYTDEVAPGQYFGAGENHGQWLLYGLMALVLILALKKK